VINGTSHFGGVLCFGISPSVKYVYMSTNSKCPLITPSWILFASLLERNALSHYGGVICFVHITNLENMSIWGSAT
jgi:hypothetical protein